MTYPRRLWSQALPLALLALLGLTLAAALIRPHRASAHYIGCDATDGGEIRWTSTTVHVTQRDYAIAQWNALGRITIAPDTASTAADVTFEDVRRPDKTWAGRYVCRWILIDLIQFNRAYTDGYSDARKKNVALHELGHALRLGHSFTGQVMNPTVSTVVTPQSHDRSDYCAQWGCGGGGGSGSSGGDPRGRVLP